MSKQRAFVTKVGKYGPLYRYVVTYTDRSDPGFGEETWCTWAYNLEDAEERFYMNDEHLSILNLRRLHKSLAQHRAVRHEPRS
jgi:hypothetical protein